MLPLLELPEELLLKVSALLAIDLPSTLRLLQACTLLNARLASVREAAQAQRHKWLQMFTMRIQLSNGGRTATSSTSHHTLASWTAGHMLPISMASSWHVRIDQGESGQMNIGLCDAQRSYAWTVARPHNHQLPWRTTGLRFQSGKPELNGKPPRGYPSLPLGRRVGHTLYGSAEGKTISILYDPVFGTLTFNIGNGDLKVSGFPRRVAMRPFLRMTTEGQQVTIGSQSGEE